MLEQRYGRAVDWWAFGVLTYEMLLGQSPFRGEDEDEIFDAILEDEPLYPITMPRDAVSILQKVSTSFYVVDPQIYDIPVIQLLQRDPNRRLGSGKEDAEEIKRQPFFKDVNWDDVLHKRIAPPYFPKIVSHNLSTLYWSPLNTVAERSCRYEQFRRRIYPREANTNTRSWSTNNSGSS